MNTNVEVLKRFVSFFAIPVFSVLFLGLGVCTVIAMAGGFLYTLGTGIRMELWPNYSIPQYLGLPAGLVFGILLLTGAIFCFRLVKYFVASWYR
ncbi:hypothetical protein [Priestia endophytica]|uniref:hypothetical protein n=1 Tax=Priestia endophytica TaxID=135735 RepID=UPI000DCA6E6C|nr:hypothetical protein [Priestia endophytica]MCM3536356.1 hypothetical protein [Priestia endophytica]RAS86115.1 hypothetical protein A4U60_08410 [Priestia endophytica]